MALRCQKRSPLVATCIKADRISKVRLAIEFAGYIIVYPCIRSTRLLCGCGGESRGSRIENAICVALKARCGTCHGRYALQYTPRVVSCYGESCHAVRVMTVNRVRFVVYRVRRKLQARDVTGIGLSIIVAALSFIESGNGLS